MEDDWSCSFASSREPLNRVLSDGWTMAFTGEIDLGIVPTCEPQTFPCRQCRATVVEGRPCKSCGLEVEPAVAAEAAAERTRYIEASAQPPEP